MFECGGNALPLGMETCSETGCFADDCQVARVFVTVVTVVVDVFDVLVETNVEFPAVGQLALDGADASADVEFTDGGVVGIEIDEGVDVEIVEGACCFAFVEVVVMVAVVEADVEEGNVLMVAVPDLRMNGTDIVYVAIAESYLERVGFGLFFLAGIQMINAEHFS